MATTKLLLNQHTAEIRAQLDVAYGGIGEILTITDLQMAAKSYDWITKKALKGCTIIVSAYCSLPRAYKYSVKEIGRARLTHNGKTWVFVSADRGRCYAGQSVGGHMLTAQTAEQHDDITKQALLRLNITI